MKIAILTCGILPIPAVQGGAVENLIDFYLEYNNQKRLHDITVFSPWDAKVEKHPALSSDVNHYVFIDTSNFKARIERKIYKYFHSNEYYNHFIEYYFEQKDDENYQNLTKLNTLLLVLMGLTQNYCGDSDLGRSLGKAIENFYADTALSLVKKVDFKFRGKENDDEEYEDNGEEEF